MSFSAGSKKGSSNTSTSDRTNSKRSVDMGPWSEQADNLKSLWQLAWNVYNGNTDANTAGPYANQQETTPAPATTPTTSPLEQALLRQYQADNLYSKNYWDGGNYPVTSHPMDDYLAKLRAKQRQQRYSGEAWQ